MRVLVTNDDGVHAPGLSAITRALAQWTRDDDGAHEIVVVAPLANHSGASAAVGTVYEREAISYRRVRIDGADEVPTYGVDAPPALAVLVGALGGFGPRPDIVVSGINLGVNVGRSVLHSGTIGATLAGAQLGLRGLAVSLRAGSPPEQWTTASTIAVALLPALCAAPPRTVLNLNVPSVPLEELRGVRRARISTSGIVKQASGGTDADGSRGAGGPTSGGAQEEGEIRLTLGTAIPTLGKVESEDPEDDAALIAAGYASITPIVGVREDTAPDSDEVVRAALSTVHVLLGR
ncbi:MAG TPA: 5'/3'-nucleotidase SurE [Acidimicrobiales bacterium]|nr:5'/3'-nucleotidase SurE [Acidimicrobiales bacterium]